MDYETEAWWSRDMPVLERTNTLSETSLEGELEGGWFSPSPIQARLLDSIKKQLQVDICYTSGAE